MTNQQLTLLDHALEELEQAKKGGQPQQPLPFDTTSVCKRLSISPSTLNRAKNQNQLPYLCFYQGGTAEINFSHQEKGKDYWIVTIRKSQL